jgi:hypothetical protein
MVRSYRHHCENLKSLNSVTRGPLIDGLRFLLRRERDESESELGESEGQVQLSFITLWITYCH